MPRRHSRKRRPTEIRDVTHLAHGGAREESRRGQLWLVRDISAARAVKNYRCPGCSNIIDEGVAHIVAWEAEGLFGSEASARDRRHWHRHCWDMA